MDLPERTLINQRRSNERLAANVVNWFHWSFLLKLPLDNHLISRISTQGV
jgi:hypothetical protein